MTRVLRTLVHNWPLKLAAVGLATLLYGGLVLSQSTATLPVVIPVDLRDQPTGTFLLNTIRPVTEIRYFSPSGVQPIASDFEAWVDLSKVDPGSGPQSVSVQLRSVDPRVTVVAFQPQVVTVDLDKVERKSVPVQVDHGEVPSNLELGTTTVSPSNVDVVGPATVLTRVVAARASVVIQPTGIDVDQDVELVAIDDVGNAVNQVKIEPATSRVTIPVFSDRLTKTLPIAPQVVGTPAAGFAIGSVVTTPAVVTVEGDVDELQKLTKIDTAPISISGFSSSQSIIAPLALPTGIVALDVQSTKVDIGILAVTESRSFEVGIRFIGEKPGLSYTTELDRVLITVGGSPADLDRIIGATLAVDLDVNALGPGKADVTVVADLPPGVTLVTANPPKVTVTVAALPSSAPSSGG